MARRPKREAALRQEEQTDAPQEKSLALSLLIWSLCFVAFINVIIGAYLYTSYQNAQRRAEKARLQAQSAPTQAYTPPTADQIWGTQPPVRSGENEPEEDAQAPEDVISPNIRQSPKQPAAASAEPSAQPDANTGTSQSVAPTVQQTSSYSRENWPQGKLLGTVNSDKYHSYNCRGAQKIPKENEIWFDSAADAEAAGYKPCGTCYR